MTDMSHLPRELDLPPGRQEHLRERVFADLAAVAPGPARSRSRRIAVAAVAATAVAAAWAVSGGALPIPGIGRPEPEAIALGDGRLSLPLRNGGNECLTEAREAGNLDEKTRPSLVNYVDHPWLSVVVYQTGDRLFYCTVGKVLVGDETGDRDDDYVDAWGSTVESDTPMYGPVQLDHVEMQGAPGEYLAVAGRVGPEVHRVVFDDGAGNTREASLANGVFVTAGRYTDPDKALVISYDRAGKEIDRRVALGTSCDPTYSGVPKDLPGTVCEPQERWTPRATPEVVGG